MKTRLLALTLASAMLLSSCALFRGPRGPLPSPLPAVSTAAQIKSSWSVSMGGTEGTLLRPAVFGDSIFAGARNGTLTRIDQNGRQLWRVRSVRNLVGGVAANESLVVAGSGEGVLVAHDANTGALLWQVQLDGELGGTPFVSGNVVVARVGDNRLMAYSALDGKPLWNYQRTQASLSLRAYSGLAQSGDLLLAGFPGGKLVALTLVGGFPRWEASVAVPRGSNELERMTDVAGDPVVRDDTVCVAAFQGRVACADRNKGNLLWTRDYSSAQGVVIQGKSLALTDATGTVFMLDVQTGATIWKQDLLRYRGVGRPVFVGGAVAVADIQGWVHLMDPVDGHFVAQIRADRSGVNAPMLALPNGQLVIQAQDGTLAAFAVHY